MRLVLLYCGLFAVPFLGGWFRATETIPPPIPGVFLDDAIRIGADNLGVLLRLIPLNAFSFGVFAAVWFAVHGYVFGQVLAVIDGPIIWVALYAPIEVLAFAIAAAGSLMASPEVLKWLRSGTPIRARAFRRYSIPFALAVIGLSVAAVLESIAIQGAWN